jgi:hypothetical protein
MSNSEFATIVAYVSSAVGKKLDADAQVVYWELLGDLPAEVGWLAAKRVLLEHRWSTFPSVAELRQAAVESMRGEVKELSGAEAWAIAWRVAANTDPELDGSFDRACAKAKAPPLVVEAITTFGLLDLCYGKEPEGVLRGQFVSTFNALAARDRRAALLPAAVRESLEDIRERKAIPQPKREAAAIVGRLAESFSTPGV